jgi:hypothetical protein
VRMTTQQEPMQALPAGPLTEPVDPLAQITVRPRAFLAALAIIAMLLGLLLAILPVRVASADPGRTPTVSCGNALSGVEAGRVRDQSGDRAAQLTHLDMCDRSVSLRGGSAAVLFVGGLLGGLWLGIVRRPAVPAHAT